MKKLRSTLTLALAFAAPAADASILNIEGMRKGFDEAPGWSGSFKLDLGGSSGNTDKFNAALGVLAQHRRDGSVNLITFSSDYAEASGSRDTNKQIVHLRHTQDWKEQVAWEAFTQWQRNEFTNLTSRALIGGGLRWDLMNADRKAEGARFYLGTGAFYENQSIRNEPDRETIRANLYLSAVLPVFADSSLSGTIYFQPAFDDPGDHRATCALGFSVPMRENLSLELTFNLTYDSRPPATVEKTDVEYLTGIRWSF